MEDNRENQPLEQSAGAALQAAHTVRGALKAGKAAGGMAAGTAAGGPLGAVVGFVVSREKFLACGGHSIFACDIIPGDLSLTCSASCWHVGGMGDAEKLCAAGKRSRSNPVERTDIGTGTGRTGKLLLRCLKFLGKKMRSGGWKFGEDYESNYAGLERYELELADEHTTLFLPAYAEYLAVLFAENWNGSQIRSFLQKGNRRLYTARI